jgi:heat shock protein HslJ
VNGKAPAAPGARRLRLVVLLLVGVLAAGCVKPGDPPQPSLDGTSWLLVNTSLGVPLPAGTTITVDIRGAVISGSAGCNAYTGPLTTSTDGRFLVGPLASTDMACEPAVMEAERTFFARLSHVDSYRVRGVELELLRGTGSVIRFRATAGAGTERLAGSYRIVGVPDARTGAVAPLIPDSYIGLTLTAEGSLSGSACNTYGGAWLVDGDRFTVSDLWWHARACGTPVGVEGQEDRYFTALKAANRWEVLDGELLLYTDDRLLVRAARG